MEMNIKEKIKEYAAKIDIDLIGFTRAENFTDLEEILRERESRDFLSGFEEKNMEKRINPYLTLEEAETIIVIGISYYVAEKDVEYIKNAEIYGNISRSSWGRDYHSVLKEKMKNLSAYIERETKNFRFKYFVDTGPLVDRYLAYKAGIGWYGKNNCIISKDYGSWIFIGYIICNLKLEINDIERTSCQSCNKCIKGCPTGALMENYQYNSKLCISYLTQTKEDIDYRLREKMGNSLYGCDICQLVCPYNLYVKSGQRDFIPHRDSHNPHLLELLKLSNKEFKKKFGHTALGWRGNKIIKRNALIALGNSSKREVVKDLKEYLDNPSIMIRKYTAWAIIRLDKKRGKEILDDHLKKEEEREVIKEIKKLYKFYL